MTDLRALAEAATPGPWRLSCHDSDFSRDPLIGERSGLGYDVEGPPEGWYKGQFALHADAAFIAAAPPAVILALLDVVDAARLASEYLEATYTSDAMTARSLIRAALARYEEVTK